jgi:hypothetical protein
LALAWASGVDSAHEPDRIRDAGLDHIGVLVGLGVLTVVALAGTRLVQHNRNFLAESR